MPQGYFDFVGLWMASRGGMGGTAHWPDAGGITDQAAWAFDAFAILSNTSAMLDKMERGENA